MISVKKQITLISSYSTHHVTIPETCQNEPILRTSIKRVPRWKGANLNELF